MGACFSKQIDSKFTEQDVFRVLLIGPMGCGKSTLTQFLTGDPLAKASGASIDGCTQVISAYFVKHEIARRIGQRKVCIIDMPGTADAKLGPEKLVAKLEAALRAADVHAILLMNKASESRVAMGVQIASILLEKSFVKAADQIVGVMTQCDLVSEYKCQENKKMIKQFFKEKFGQKIPVVACAVPVNERTSKVIEQDEYKELYDKEWTQSFDPILDELTRLAKYPRSAEFVHSGNQVLHAVGELMDIPLEKMEKRIESYKEEIANHGAETERYLAELAQKEAIIEQEIRNYEKKLREQQEKNDRRLFDMQEKNDRRLFDMTESHAADMHQKLREQQKANDARLRRAQEENDARLRRANAETCLPKIGDYLEVKLFETQNDENEKVWRWIPPSSEENTWNGMNVYEVIELDDKEALRFKTRRIRDEHRNLCYDSEHWYSLGSTEPFQKYTESFKLKSNTQYREWFKENKPAQGSFWKCVTEQKTWTLIDGKYVRVPWVKGLVYQVLQVNDDDTGILLKALGVETSCEWWYYCPCFSNFIEDGREDDERKHPLYNFEEVEEPKEGWGDTLKAIAVGALSVAGAFGTGVVGGVAGAAVITAGAPVVLGVAAGTAAMGATGGILVGGATAVSKALD